MPKIVDPIVEKQKIINAFRQCVLKKPLEKVTVRDIAKEAGISHAKIFIYFKSKDEIIVAYARQIAHLYSLTFENIVTSISREKCSKKESLRNLISELYRIDPDNTVERLYAQIYILGQYNEEMRSVVLKAYSDWRNSLQGMLKAFGSADAESEMRSLLVLVEGILIYRMNDTLSQEEALKIVSDLFVESE